jgi:periplasmic protein TonB
MYPAASIYHRASSHLVERQASSYPKLAKLTRVRPVLLQALVSGDGAVESVHAIKGPYLIRGAASKAVRTWRYKPYLLDGKAIEVATIVTVGFVLNN